MRAVSFILIALLSASLAQESTTKNINENINAIETKPSVRLDPYIRKALLKALTELEEHDNQTTESENTEESTVNSYTNSEILQTGDDITDTEPTQSSKEEIQIHSFVVNGQSAFDKTTNLPTFFDSNISILSTTAGNVENQVTATLPTQTVFNEIFQTRESINNLQQVRSIQKTNNNAITDKDAASRTTTTKTTTTTTTTTPKPTHNDDGENIEDVDKRDVQVFQAPLVAAFTVHQDARGSPKKVVPIFQQPAPRIPEPPKPVTPAQPNNFNHQRQIPANQNQAASNIQNFNSNKSPDPVFFNQQLILQKQLEEKQRALEEQLRLLQIQQRQQEELLRKQQILLQQKEVQRQQQNLIDQQRLQNNVGNNNFQLHNVQDSKFQNQFPIQNNNAVRQNSQVQIQPSLSLEHANIPNTINHQQQLPNREAVDFLIHLRNQQQEQFPLQANHLPQGISNFLQPGQFHQGPNVNNLSPFNDQFRQKQGNRVFRQEAGVGNFGINNQNFNRFNNFAPVNQQNRFFPFNRQFSHNSDAELKQLLAQSGLSGRSHEDLNIVSKVLSLNHGIPLNNNLSNRLPFDSRRQIRT